MLGSKHFHTQIADRYPVIHLQKKKIGFSRSLCQRSTLWASLKWKSTDNDGVPSRSVFLTIVFHWQCIGSGIFVHTNQRPPCSYVCQVRKTKWSSLFHFHFHISIVIRTTIVIIAITASRHPPPLPPHYHPLVWNYTNLSINWRLNCCYAMLVTSPP